MCVAAAVFRLLLFPLISPIEDLENPYETSCGTRLTRNVYISCVYVFSGIKCERGRESRGDMLRLSYLGDLGMAS